MRVGDGYELLICRVKPIEFGMIWKLQKLVAVVSCVESNGIHEVILSEIIV